jgi:hypothetical protein
MPEREESDQLDEESHGASDEDAEEQAGAHDEDDSEEEEGQATGNPDAAG